MFYRFFSRRVAVIAVLVAGLAFAPCAIAAEHESAGGDEQEEGKLAPLPEFEYVQMNPITLPVLGNNGVSQQISIIVSLEVKYGTTTDVKTFEPKLTDAYIQDLYGILGTGRGIAAGGTVDVQMLKDRLTQITQKVAGADKVHDVLLQVVHQHPY